MLQLALAALLAGSLIAGGPNGDKDKDKAKAQAQQPIESILVSDRAASDDDAIINDTYAFGRAEETPIKLWVGYGYGVVSDAYLPNGDKVGDNFGEITVQRAFVGAQVNVLNLSNFKIGIGGQLNVAQDDFDQPPLRSASSDFTLQGAKAYAVIKGRTLGIHGGYMFDLGPDGADEVHNSDGADALFFGADFDYPSERFRLFGGIDYFNRDFDDDASEDFPVEANQLVVFNAGAGIRFGFVEIGAAALLRTNIKTPGVSFPGVPGSGSHQGSIAPYLTLSPGSIPVSLSIKGAVLGEYADYGLSLGGAGDLVTNQGVTGTLTLGF